MTSLKVLKKRSALIAMQLDVDKSIFNATLELLEKGKIAKPGKVFKDTVPKIERKRKYSFLVMDMGQKKYFLMGDLIPMGAELDKKLKEVQKQLAKAKKPIEKEFLGQHEFFFTQLNELKIKGFATGVIKFSREHENPETEVLEHLMRIKTSSLKVGGSVKKNTIVDLVRDLGYELTSKLGEVMYLELGKEENDEAEEIGDLSKEKGEEQGSVELVDNEGVKNEIKLLFNELKKLPPNKLFKGLIIINSMMNLIQKLEKIPKNLEALSEKLLARQTKIVPVFSDQIDQILDQSMKKLERMPSINSSEELEVIFESVQKMYAVWKKVMPLQIHPTGKVIEGLKNRIDLIKKYEQKIVPLREKYSSMKGSKEKIRLGNEINVLIKNARTALA